MTGGNSRVLPLYNHNLATKNEKEEYSKHIKEKQPQEQRPEKQYQEYTQENTERRKPVPTYPSPIVPIINPYNPFSTTYSVPLNNIPIIKKYNISLAGADNNIQSVAEIFEDILPQTHVAINKSTTLSERLVLYSYIRSILVTKGDGQEIALTDKKNPEIINLLSYMKMLEINPYHFSRLTNNHYRTMPDNFVMFRSCYPIRLDKTINMIHCAKEAVKANIRIYSLLNYDYIAYRMDKNGVMRKYSDIWREIFFYQYIREEILKKKMCPHFPLLYSYYITKSSGLDFDKIKELKKKYIDKNDIITINNNDIRQNFFDKTMESLLSLTNKGITVNVDSKKQLIDVKTEAELDEIINKENKFTFRDDKNTIVIRDKFEIDLTKRSGKCLVAITESPNQNIINWATRTYIIDDGPVRKQISTGVHSVLEWKVIIFQLVIAMYVMEQKQIIINELSWNKNIFIKDLELTDSVGYWKYNISGLLYYVPNVGNLLMIDSSFDDIKDGINFTLGKTDNEMQFKLYGALFDDSKDIKIMDKKINLKDFNDMMILNFQNIFSRNNLGNEFSNYGGINPPDEILKLLDDIGNENYKGKNKQDEIENDANIMTYQDIILKYFTQFLHNKIGKIVNDIEIKQLYRPGFINKFSKGELVAIKSQNIDVLKWGIYIRKLENANFSILTNDENEELGIHEHEYTISEISKIYGKIEQNYELNDKLIEEEILETYKL
jgi:hypothetical protein